MRSLSIVIPAFNEESRLGPTLNAVIEYVGRQNLMAEIIVVDDGSTDRTAELAENFASEHSMVRLVRNGENRGKGYSVRHGMQEAKGEIMLMCDADLSVPIEQCEHLIAALDDGYDIAIGSRALNEELILKRPPFYRRICSSSYRAMVRNLLGLEFKDTQCGFKAFTREAARRIFAMQKIEQWGFDPEILLIGSLMEFRIKEVAVETFHREGSKINPILDSIKMFIELLMIRRHVFAEFANLRHAAASAVIPIAQDAARNQAEAA